MQRLVCVDRRSPQFAGRFLDEPVSFFVKKETILLTFSFQFFSSLLCVIRECWCNDPTARLPTLRVQKDIVRFYEQTKKWNMWNMSDFWFFHFVPSIHKTTTKYDFHFCHPMFPRAHLEWNCVVWYQSYICSSNASSIFWANPWFICISVRYKTGHLRNCIESLNPMAWWKTGLERCSLLYQTYLDLKDVLVMTILSCARIPHKFSITNFYVYRLMFAELL